MPYITETQYQELTEARYQDEQTIADLEAELKTKERDTEHLLELGKQFAALTSERDRLREAAQQANKELRRKLKDGETVYNILYSAQEILTAALDKDAKG